MSRLRFSLSLSSVLLLFVITFLPLSRLSSHFVSLIIKLNETLPLSCNFHFSFEPQLDSNTFTKVLVKHFLTRFDILARNSDFVDGQGGVCCGTCWRVNCVLTHRQKQRSLLKKHPVELCCTAQNTRHDLSKRRPPTCTDTQTEQLVELKFLLQVGVLRRYQEIVDFAFVQFQGIVELKFVPPRRTYERIMWEQIVEVSTNGSSMLCCLRF